MWKDGLIFVNGDLISPRRNEDLGGNPGETEGLSDEVVLSSVFKEEAKSPLTTSDISIESFAHVSLNITDAMCVLGRDLLVLSNFACSAAPLVVFST